jgi:hypothetical protein
MARKAEIAKLADELRKAIDEKLADPRYTLDELVVEVRKIAPPDAAGLSRSALQRRQQDISIVGERIRRSKDIADALVEKFGEADDDTLARLNNQVVQTTIMELLAAADEDGQPVTLSTKQIADLCKGLSELARAKKTEADRFLKVRAETAEKTITAVDGALKAAKQPGITREMRDQINQRVLGVPT